MLDEFVDVGTLERIATGQHDDGLALKPCGLIEQRDGLASGKFIAAGAPLRGRAAVFADEVAGAGDLVVKHERAAVEVGIHVRWRVHGSGLLGCSEASVRFDEKRA